MDWKDHVFKVVKDMDDRAGGDRFRIIQHGNGSVSLYYKDYDGNSHVLLHADGENKNQTYSTLMYKMMEYGLVLLRNEYEPKTNNEMSQKERIDALEKKVAFLMELNSGKKEKPLPVFNELYYGSALISGDPNCPRLKKLLTLSRLMAVARYINESWVPDMTTDCQAKFFICYNTDGEFDIDVNHSSSSSPVLFNSEEAAEKAIEIFRHNGAEQELIDFFS